MGKGEIAWNFLQVTSLRYHSDPTPSVLSLEAHLLHPRDSLPKYQLADHQRSGDSGGIGEETCCQGMAAAADGH